MGDVGPTPEPSVRVIAEAQARRIRPRVRDEYVHYLRVRDRRHLEDHRGQRRAQDRLGMERF